MVEPQLAKIFVLWFGFFGECADEGATGDASCVTYWPAFIFEAIDKSAQKVFNVFFKSLFVFRVVLDDFGAKF